ncbi:MAG: zinc-binding dehydrogenase [Alphaproteobacteria bacterium]|nr:zinc-binding dehydrogenase [Alphaproteobacteria bacterium]
MATHNTRSLVFLTGHGDPSVLQYHENQPIPLPAPDEVIIEVTTAGVNNTDINTRLAWYDDAVTTATNDLAAQQSGKQASESSSWKGAAIAFPRIQGADIMGTIVQVGAGGDTSRIGERTLVSAIQNTAVGSITVGSECDGGFTSHAVMKAKHCYSVGDSPLSDAQLGAIPCAYSTAYNMLLRVEQSMGWRDYVGELPTLHGKRVLVSGASGGVGYAAVELAKIKGAHVTAIVSESKVDALRSVADDVVVRPSDNTVPLDYGKEDFHVAVDLVGGQNGLDAMLKALRHGGYYVISGAIAGPIATIDLRKLYLRDLSYLGATFQHPTVFANLIELVRAGTINPIVAKTFPLSQIVEAQKFFVGKSFVGKVVLLPQEA